LFNFFPADESRLNESVFEYDYRTLELFFKSKAESIYLPSHDFNHHIRVWRNAVYITNQLAGNGFTFNSDFLRGLQVACLLHDIGMATNRGEDHGKAGRLLAEEFLSNSDIPDIIKNEVFFAIGNHDRKDYSKTAPPDSMLTILSVADDVDALSYIGIYRYIEINLERGIDLHKTTNSVATNLSGRYAHMARVYSFMKDYIAIQEKRFEVAFDFFNSKGAIPDSSRETIINIIGDELLKKRKDLKDICRNYKSAGDHNITQYFGNLYNELVASEQS